MFTDYMRERARYLNSLAVQGKSYGLRGWDQDVRWKDAWLKTGRSVFRAIGKELAFDEMKVSVNPAGTAVTGETTLMGMWHTRQIGIYVDTPLLGEMYHNMNRFSDTGQSDGPYFMWRTITHMKDYGGTSINQWEPYESLLDLDTLVTKFNKVGVPEVL
jgi:hypothetical protein